MTNDDYDSMIDIALFDAATNCARDDAVARVTLRSGVVLVGHLEKPKTPRETTLHMKTATGWVTALKSEVAAVEAAKNKTHYGDPR
jgi:hypothetical protein